MGFFDWLHNSLPSKREPGSPEPRAELPEIRLSKRAAKALAFGDWKLSSQGLPTTRVTYKGGRGLREFVGSSSVTFAVFDAEDVKLGEWQTDMAYLEVGQTGKITIPLDNLDEEEVSSVAYVVINIDA
jgi:hypothetical protein